MNLENLDPTEWLKLNAKLQSKKNHLRQDLKKKGVLKKGKSNDFDHYTYFSEAQYKELFTELLSENNLELKFSELDYGTFEGTGKQCNGRLTKLEFTLFDVETGFFETTVITGEGMDKGDKAGYKAYTGAVKYYLADTFLVATGDDAEKESPSENMNTKTERKATAKQIEVLKKIYTGDNLTKLLNANHISKIEDLSMETASDIITKISKSAQKQG